MTQSAINKLLKMIKLILKSYYRQQQVKTTAFFFIQPEKFTSLKMVVLHTAARIIYQK
jgi:hypothetical protein